MNTWSGENKNIKPQYDKTSWRNRWKTASSRHLSMPSQTHSGGNVRGWLSRRATSGQGTARTAWGSHTAVTHGVSLRAELFKKSLLQAAILPACTEVHCLLRYTVCRAFSTRHGNDALKAKTTPASPQLFFGRFLSSDHFHDLHYGTVWQTVALVQAKRCWNVAWGQKQQAEGKSFLNKLYCYGKRSPNFSLGQCCTNWAAVGNAFATEASFIL